MKAVLFDLDHTLYDREATLAQMAPAFALCFQKNLRVTGNEYDLAAHLIASDRMVYGGWPAIYAHLEHALPWDPPGYEAFKAFMNASLGSCATAYPETSDVLRWCRGRGLVVGIVTNGSNALQNRKIDTLGIRDCLDCIVISEAAGAQKPDPAIFRHALQLTGTEPRETVFVGDNPENDILGSAALGMIPIWLDHFSQWPEGKPFPAYVAHRLADVPGVIEEIMGDYTTDI